MEEETKGKLKELIEYPMSEFIEYLRLEKQVADYLKEHPSVERAVQKLIKQGGLCVLANCKLDF